MTTSTKHCPKCARDLYLDQFSKDKSKKDLHRNYCKECEKKRVANYNREHREERIAYGREWYYFDLEQSRRREREYSQSNLDKVRENRRNAQRRYRNNHPEAVRARGIMSRKKKTGHPEIQAMYQSQQGKCHYCDVMLGGHYEIDHVIPLLRGGTNTLENIVLCCPTCNRSKGTKISHEWDSVRANY